MRDRWGPDGPPPEAYSRVTDPERFRPLHAMVETLLGGLNSSFEVERTAGYGLDDELETSALALPTVRLTPRDATAAPLVVAFTTFPGIRLRAGHWCTEPFPSCGCDACSETADDEALRLQEMVDNVVAGRFREVISVPLIGNGWQECELWSQRGRRRSRSRIMAEARSRYGRVGRARFDRVGEMGTPVNGRVAARRLRPVAPVLLPSFASAAAGEDNRGPKRCS